MSHHFVSRNDVFGIALVFGQTLVYYCAVGVEPGRVRIRE